MFLFELPSRCSRLLWLDTWVSLRTLMEDEDLAVNAALPSRGGARRAPPAPLLMLMRSFENRSSDRVVMKYLDEGSITELTAL